MTRRIAINLCVFAALAVIMVIWAFNNVIRFDFIDRPYHITVQFESSPGLHPNFEVDYLGLRVGKIDSVKLEQDKVVVRLDMNRGVKIPKGVSAAAARKSAVGEPVVELTPPPGQGQGTPEAMRDGEVIPVSRTKVPPKYGDLFDAVLSTLNAIKPEDAKILTHELAEGWSGREDSLRQIINGGDDLTATLAQNTDLLDGLTKDLARISTVLNDHRGDLGAGIDNVAALTGALAQVRGQLAELRDRGPTLLGTVNGLLDETGDDFGCAVDAVGTLGLTSYDPDLYSDLGYVLDKAPQLNHVLNSVIGEEGGKPVLNVVFQVTLKKQAALEYKYPKAQPGVNPKLSCPGGRQPVTAPQKTYPGKSPGQTIPTHDASADVRDVKAQQAANAKKDSSGGPPIWLVYVPPVLALLVLIRVMAGSVPVVSRLTRLPRLRRRGRD
ncbi:MCE family protein [Actinomadura parmotrematis]|uniref:MCE family protein n=1 Tax=Actinomadura parmotrematis TaxID=2864039 RepID=A0ABS7G4W7_9ACTN|nr:MCE family protein [Actinomadura parmotrematis]MBW8486668.1 MCE family protein [Actinomadura parmotrematis]